MNKEQQRNRLPIKGTRATIVRRLLENDLSALDLEEKLGINESAVRRHLEVLEQENYVEHYFEKASRGRPKKLFALTERGRDIFPEKSHLLFTLLAKSVEEKYGTESLAGLFSDLADRLAESLDIREDKGDLEERMEEFMDAMEDFGFYPALKKENGSYEIQFRNCVFRAGRSELGKKICGLHDGFVRSLFPEAKVEPKNSMARGGDTCLYKIHPKENRN